MKRISRFLIGYYNNQSSKELQAFMQKDSIPVCPMGDGLEEFFDRSLRPMEKKVLNYFVMMHKHYRWVYVSQARVATLFHITRPYANAIIRRLKELGFIDSFYRHMNTSIYRLSSFFSNNEVVSRLRHILPALRFLGISLLLTFSPELTQSINRELCIYNCGSDYVRGRCAGNCMKQFQQVMNGDSPVSEKLRAVTKVLNLSRAGQIRLSAFPDEAIIAAAEEFKYAKSVRDPFGWFCKLCIDYCKRNEIAPDWDFRNKMLVKYGINEKSSPIRNLEPDLKTPAAAVKKQRSSNEYQGSQKDTSRPAPYRQWEGHTEPPRQQQQYSSEQRKETIMKALLQRREFMDALYRLAPSEARLESYQLIFNHEACYCHDIKERWGWDFIADDGTCLHERKGIDEEIYHTGQANTLATGEPVWSTSLGHPEITQT